MNKQQPIGAGAVPQPEIVTDPSAEMIERRQVDGRIEHPGVLLEQAPRSVESPVRIALPQAPRLEAIESPTPADNSFAVAQREREDRLHNNGPTDEPGFVHVPIEKAMEKVAKNSQTQTPPSPRNTKSGGLLGGGEANSGRVFREESR